MGEAEDKFERTSTMSVARGLHAFRYVSFQNGQFPAVAKVAISGSSEGSVDIVSMPGRSYGVLSKPGDCLVLRAERAGEVLVGLNRGAPEGSLEASFRLEPLVLSEEPALSAVVSPQGKRSLALLAHVANRGDVSFGEAQWVGGPESPGVIEGLEIVEGGSRLEMQVMVGGRPPRWTGWVAGGEFAGSRGRRTPLTGIRLRLHSEEPTSSEIAAEALFLGSLVTAKSGREVEFLSPSGLDPLVGLKVSVKRIESVLSVKGGDSVAPVRDREPRVRVFRASTAR